jgi:hypothetical protein
VKGLLLAVLLINSALLAALELMLQLLYVGPVPAPVGTVVALLTMPWLVRAAGETASSPVVAGLPILVWLLVVGVLGAGGPGADVLLPANFQSALLVVAALGAGLYALRGVIATAGRDIHG